MNINIIQRAQGCLMGQLVGDSLGALVEFKTAKEIASIYPQGVRDLADGGTWNTIAGQPTDDSEMALALARTLVAQQSFDREAIREAYVGWFRSNTFGCGKTVTHALRDGRLNPDSQANGALMRVSPLGIFGARDGIAADELAFWVDQETTLTHIHPLCRQANILFVEAIAQAVRYGKSPAELYQAMLQRARLLDVEPLLLTTLEDAARKPPEDYVRHQGWVLIALQNAIWQLLHAPDLETGIMDTVMRGGDTDTNAAIAGALLGAVYGIEAVPERWQTVILHCRPSESFPRVVHPRPKCFWPEDALELAGQLIFTAEYVQRFRRALEPIAPDKPFCPMVVSDDHDEEELQEWVDCGLVELDECGLYFLGKLGEALMALHKLP